MADTKKLVWDETGSRLYETGVSQCALYVQTTGGAYGEGYRLRGEDPAGHHDRDAGRGGHGGCAREACGFLQHRHE